MPTATANGKTFKFPDGTSPEQMGMAIDEYFAGQQKQQSKYSPQVEQMRQQQIQDQPMTLMEQRSQALGVDQMDSRPELTQSNELNFEQLRVDNPALAQAIEETSEPERLAVGFQQGLRTVGRGVGKIAGQDFFPEVNDPELKALQDVSSGAQAGKILGEAAPFLPLGGLTGRVASTPLRSLSMGGIGAAEGGTIAAGEDRSAGDVAKSAAAGFVLGAGAEAAPAIVRGLRSKSNVSKNLLKEPTKKEIAQGIADAVPTSEELRSASSGIYKDVRDLGINVNSDAYSEFVDSTFKDAGDLLDLPKAGESLTPESARLIKRMESMVGSDVDINELERLRRLAMDGASSAARAGRNQDAAASRSIADNIDSFMFDIKPRLLTGETKNIGEELKVARDLWGRAKRSDLLDSALEDARTQASGFENGIRRQFERIVKNKKLSKFFKPEELEAMKQVVEGSTGANFFKKLGKLGFGRGQQTNVMSGTMSTYAASDLFGGVVGALFAATGQVSKALAERLTKNNAAMATQIIRAGSNANDIAKAYLKFTPKAQQSAEELSQLLMRQDIDLNAVDLSGGLQIVNDAVNKAKSNLPAQAAVAGAVASQPLAAEEEQ